jgi:hypothetical protein
MNEGDTKYYVSSGRPLTAAEIARLDEIEARLGHSVDIPTMSDEAWATAVRRKHRKTMHSHPVPARTAQ